MTIRLTLLGSLNTGTGTSQGTGTVTTKTGMLQLLAVASFPGTGVSNSLTASGFTLVRPIYNYNAGDAERSISLWQKYATGTSDSSTLTFTSSQQEFQWHWIEVDDDVNSSLIFEVKQSAVNLGSSSTASVNLGSFQSASNGTLGIIGVAGVFLPITVGSGFTSLASTSGTVQGDGLLSEWKSSNDTTVDATGGGSDFWGAMGVELGVISGTPIAWIRA